MYSEPDPSPEKIGSDQKTCFWSDKNPDPKVFLPFWNHVALTLKGGWLEGGWKERKSFQLKILPASGENSLQGGPEQKLELI